MPGSSSSLDPGAVAQLVTQLLNEQDASALTDRVLHAARDRLGMELTFLSHFEQGDEVLRALLDPDDAFPLNQGDRFDTGTGYCERQVAGLVPNLLPDVRNDPLTRDLTVTEELDVGAYIGVAVRLADGTLHGTLCGMSHAARPDLQEADVRFLQVLAAIISAELSRDPQRTAVRRRHAGELARALSGEGTGMLFQPIFSLADRRIVGVEALSRFDGRPPPRPPDQWFAAAWDVGLGPALELAAVRRAVEAVALLPADAYLAVNADPRTVLSPSFEEAVEPASGRLLVELTEHAPVRDYGPLAERMRALRMRGVRFAVDDAGAGYSSLNHMVRVSPDVIKLDRFLVRGVDVDPARRALVAAAGTFASSTGTQLVAEGIETAGELEAITEAGVPYGQGFLLGEPGPVEALGR